MARGDRTIGKVVRYGRGQRFKLDFGRRWGPRYLYSFRGISFESEEMAQAILSHVQMEVAKGRGLDDILSEYAPEATSSSNVEALLPRWLSLFEQMVRAGDRQPRTLREYRRWAGNANDPASHFSYWYGRSVFEIDTASLKEWSYWLAEKGLGGKTRWNVMAGFHAFLEFVGEQRRTFSMPRYPWPEKDVPLRRVTTWEQQDRILGAIDESKRGIFLFLADGLARPSEARVLRVRDWDGHPAGEIRVEEAAKDRRIAPRAVVRGTKKRRGKVLPVTPRLGAWLTKHVTRETRIADPDGPLFPNPDPQSETGWWSDTGLRRVWGTAAKKVGVSIALYAGTKHTTATHLKGKGVDDRTLATVMGHSDARSVEPYAQVQTETVRGVLRHLGRSEPDDL